MLKLSFFRICGRIVAFALMFLITSCSQISNKFSVESLECSLPLEAEHQIFKISSYDPSFGIEVTHVSDQTLEMNELAVNSKGCFTLSKELKGHLVLRGLDKTELLGAVYPLPHSDGTRSIEKLALSRIQPSNIYPKLCEDKSIQYTSSNHFDFAIPSSLLTSDHFYVMESQSHGRSLRKVFTSSLNNQAGLLSVDELKDGKNDLMFNVFDLLQSKKVLREESCSVFVDTVNPSVVVKRSDGNSVVEADSVFAPGERIYLNGEEGIKLNYCLHQTDGVVEDQCSEIVGSGFITLPQGGRWTLRTTVTDLAGNSHTESLALRVYNDSAVKLIRAQAITNMGGDSRSSLKKAADLERDRLALYGKDEREELETETKVAMLSALSRGQKVGAKAYECSQEGVIPLTITKDKVVVLSEDENFVCIYQLDGILVSKINNHSEGFGFTKDARFLNTPKTWKSNHLVRYLEGKFIFFDLTNGDVKSVVVSNDIHEYDIDQVKGTIYALDSGEKVLHRIEFDGQTSSQVKIKLPTDDAFDRVIYLPFASGPKLFLQWMKMPNSLDFSLLCDISLSLSECSRDENFTRHDWIRLSPDNKWFSVVRGLETKIWSFNDTLPLSTDNAIRGQGTFARFLEGDRYITTGYNSWEVWKINEDRVVDRKLQGELLGGTGLRSLHFNQNVATLIQGSRISQWQFGNYNERSQLIDNFPFEGPGIFIYGSPGKNSGEYVIFSSEEISTYRLGCLCKFEVFKGGSAALQIANESVIYSNAQGKTLTFKGKLLRMSPDKKFAIIEEDSEDESKGLFVWHLINQDGDIVSSIHADGQLGSSGYKLVSARDESTLMAMDSMGDYKIFETGVEKSSFNLRFESGPRWDASLTPIKGTVISEYENGIEIYNYEKNTKRFIPNSKLILVGNLFPFILYERYRHNIVIEDIESGRQIEWPFEEGSSFSAKTEKCGVFSINLKGSVESTQLIDLSSFEVHKFDLMDEVACEGLIPRLTLTRYRSTLHADGSFIVDKSFQISHAVPHFLYPLGLGRLYGRKSGEIATQLYDETGAFLRSHSMEGKEFRAPHGAYFPESYVFLEDKNKPDEFEYLDADFNHYIVPNKKPIQRLGNFQNMGRLLWLEDRDLLIDTDLTNPYNPKYVAIPTPIGVKFLPLDNASLLKLIDQEISNTSL